MDVVEFIQGLNLFDILVVFFVAAFFVVGYIQGTLRRALGLAIALVSLLLALNLRDPLGAWLAQYWRQLPQDYVYMLALGGSFLVIYVLGSITVQTFYRKTVVFSKATVVDEVLGGVLGAVQALLLVSALIITLGLVLRPVGRPHEPQRAGNPGRHLHLLQRVPRRRALPLVADPALLHPVRLDRAPDLAETYT